MMNIPQIASIETAVQMYYEKIALYNKDIITLFPGIGSATVIRLKQIAREKANEMGRMQYSDRSVITDCAYKAWGLDIAALERRLNKLRKYQKVAK